MDRLQEIMKHSSGQVNYFYDHNCASDLDVILYKAEYLHYAMHIQERRMKNHTVLQH